MTGRRPAQRFAAGGLLAVLPAVFLGMPPAGGVAAAPTLRVAGVDRSETAAAVPAAAFPLERLVPGARVSVSAINGFVAPHVRHITGPTGPDRAGALAARLVGESRALARPVLGNLRADHTTDGCHPDDGGRRLLGGALLGFFG